jgi:hypothetical protein
MGIRKPIIISAVCEGNTLVFRVEIKLYSPHIHGLKGKFTLCLTKYHNMKTYGE